MPDQQTYTVTAPNGQTLDITGTRMPTEAELQQIFAQTSAKTPASSPQPFLRSRTGTLYQPPTESGLKEFGQGLLDPIRSIPTVVKGLATEPVQTVKDLAMGVASTPFRLVTDPARTLGQLTTGAAMPEMPRGAAVGTRGAARFVAEHPEVVTKPAQIAAGHLLGPQAGLPIGVGEIVGATTKGVLEQPVKSAAGAVAHVADRAVQALTPKPKAPGVMARPAPKALPPGPIVPPAPADPSFARAVPAEPLPGGQYASSPGPATELVDLLMQREAPSPPPSAPKPSIKNLTKADQARITALDREVGATETGRALRHDPRFKTMKPADRTAAIRSVSREQPGALPMQARRTIDDYLSKMDPAARATEIQRAIGDPKTNAAIVRYLQTLVQPQ